MLRTASATLAPVARLVLTTSVGLLAVPATAVAPTGGLPVEAAQPGLERTPSTQARLGRHARLRALSERWGGWTIRFDERTGRPHRAELPGIAVARSESLVDDLLTVLTADQARPIRLSQPTTRRDRERWVQTWQQEHDGLPMHGTELALFALSGRIQAVRMDLVDPPREAAPIGAELWWPARDLFGRVQWAPARRTEVDDVVSIWHVDGHLLERWTLRRHTTVELQHDARKPGDALVESPLVDAAIDDGTGPIYSDSAGFHAASDPYALSLDGERLRMRDWGQSGGPTPSFSDLEGDRLLEVEGDLPFAVADTWHHTKVVEAWLESYVPDHAILDIQVVASVNIGNFSCNAYYTGGTVNFARRTNRCANTGRLGDVIYHEYGHGVHHYGLLAGSFAGDLSEGTADYISATILDDPKVGVGFFNDSRALRDVSIDRVYPTNFRGQVHNDGRIWSSFLWNLRAQWEQTYGKEAAVAKVDQLMLDAMSTGPRLTTVGDAVILADDDDGDLSNGTPHACELVELLDAHGIGPGPIGVVEIVHEPIERAGSYETEYPLDLGVYDAMPDCSGMDRESVALWYTTDAITAEDAEDPFVEGEGESASAATGPSFTSAGGAVWSRLELTGEASGDYAGAIPRQLATTRVHYFIEARSLDGSARVTTHDGDLDAVYTFRVGDMESVWCEDFEALDGLFDPNAQGEGEGDTDDTDVGMDTDPPEPGTVWEASTGTPWEAGAESHVNEWSVGAPGEGLWNPDAAYSGGAIVATNLDGTYRNRNSQYLRSPFLSVPAEGRAVTLSFRRWLTVEDAKFDKARIYLDEEQIFEQRTTATGNSGGDHTLDTGWKLIELDVADVLGQDVQLTWTLSSDPGLEYGGWALDDVCIERLADLPGHHRPRDFALTVDAEDVVSATWTQPWIAPLDEVIVVRKRGGLPAGREDGLWVSQASAPEPGTEGLAMDAETEPCTTYGYAVFLRGDGVWYDAVVDGENAGLIETSCAPGQDTDLPTPVDPSVDGPLGGVDAYQLPEIEGCGCQASPASGVPWLALLGLTLLVRRRRP